MNSTEILSRILLINVEYMSIVMSHTSIITNTLTISREGMKLEAIDPEHQSLICVVSVVEVQGHR
jgi:hypothetical protein